MRYICRECANKLGLSWSPIVINEVGRKSCAVCGSNDKWQMDVLPKIQFDRTNADADF